MSNDSGRSSSDVPISKIALSWADVVLLLLILAIGFESARLAPRLTETVLGPAPSDMRRETALAELEQRVERDRAALNGLRAALVKERVDASRERATMEAIVTAHPRVAQPPQERQPDVPDWVRSAYAQSELKASVGASMIRTLTDDIAGREAEIAREVEKLRLARNERDEANAADTRARGWRVTAATAALTLLGALAALLVAWAVLPASDGTSLIHVRAVVKIAAAGLAILSMHLVAGIVGSLGVVLLLGAILLRRASRTPQPAPGVGTP